MIKIKDMIVVILGIMIIPRVVNFLFGILGVLFVMAVFMGIGIWIG